MKMIRKICITVILLLFLLGSVPACMGFYNRPILVLGMPCFMLGIVSLALAMIAATLLLFILEGKKGGDE